MAGLKVAHLIDSGGLYGAEKVVLALALEQKKRGLQPLIVSGGKPGDGDKALDRAAREIGIPIRQWRTTMIRQLSEFDQLVQDLTESGYCVFHSHGYKFDILCSLIPPRRRGAAAVATLHGYVAGNRLSKLGIYEALDKILLKKLDFVAAVSATLLAEARARGAPAGSSRCIQNCIGPVLAAASPKYAGTEKLPEFALQHDFVIGFIGRLSSEKRVDRLLEALEIVRGDYPGTALCIAGEGGQRQFLERIVKRQRLSSSVLFCGYISDVPRNILPYIDCIALSSETEGLPVVLLEAMQNRVPVIATSVGSIPELLDWGRAGLLCAKSDSMLIAQAVRRLIEDRGLGRELVGRAKQRVDELYSVASMTDAYENIYRHALQSMKTVGRWI